MARRTNSTVAVCPICVTRRRRSCSMGASKASVVEGYEDFSARMLLHGVNPTRFGDFSWTTGAMSREKCIDTGNDTLYSKIRDLTRSIGVREELESFRFLGI